MNQIGLGEGSNLLAHKLAQLGIERLGWLGVGVQGDIGVDALTLDIVRVADDGGFGRARPCGGLVMPCDMTCANE